jgi:hypothetical protein
MRASDKHRPLPYGYLDRETVVSFHDPYVESLRPEGLDTPAAALTAETVAAADGVVIATHHSSYDWAWLQQHARLIVDTRHLLPRTNLAVRMPVPGSAWGFSPRLTQGEVGLNRLWFYKGT